MDKWRRARLNAPETSIRYAEIAGKHVHTSPTLGEIDVDSICEGRFDAAVDMVSVLARHLGRDQSQQCRASALEALARCAPLGCVVTVGAAIKHLQDNDPNVQLVAVDVLSRVARKGDKNAIAALVLQLTGHAVKDPTQPGAFVNGADPQKRSLAHMARRPGDHSFRQAPQLRVMAVRALAAICVENDLRVHASDFVLSSTFVLWR